MSRKRSVRDPPSSWSVDGDETLLSSLWEQLSLKKPRTATASPSSRSKRSREDAADGAVDELVAMCRDVCLHLPPEKRLRSTSAPAGGARVSLLVEHDPASIAEEDDEALADDEGRVRVTVRVRLPNPVDPAWAPGPAGSVGVPTALALLPLVAPLPTSDLERSVVLYMRRDAELLAALRRALHAARRPAALAICDRRRDSSEMDLDDDDGFIASAQPPFVGASMPGDDDDDESSSVYSRHSLLDLD